MPVNNTARACSAAARSPSRSNCSRPNSRIGFQQVEAIDAGIGPYRANDAFSLEHLESGQRIDRQRRKQIWSPSARFQIGTAPANVHPRIRKGNAKKEWIPLAGSQPRAMASAISRVNPPLKTLKRRKNACSSPVSRS